MSGIQMPPEGMQRPPVEGMPPKDNAIERNKSVFNPTDAAQMLSSGQMRQDMTVKDFIENVFKVPITAPATALAEAIKKQAGNRTVRGKASSIAEQAQGPQGPMPQRPMREPQQGGGSQGLADLMNR